MKFQYRTVYTNTLAGLKQAERLHQNGWLMYYVGLFMIRFYRKAKS